MFQNSKYLVFILFLIVANVFGDVVVTGSVWYENTYPMGNVPVRIVAHKAIDWSKGSTQGKFLAQIDTAWDKICYSDSNGIFAVRFNMASGTTIGFQVLTGWGTKIMSLYNNDYLDQVNDINVKIPQFSSNPNSDTFDVTQSSNYSPPNFGASTIDSLLITGSLLDKMHPDDIAVKNAVIKLAYLNFAKKDSLATAILSVGASNTTHMFSFPQRYNADFVTKGLLYVSAPGYVPDTVGFNVPGLIWDGTVHTLDTTISLMPQGIVLDTVDTFNIRGTIKDSTTSNGISKAFISVLLDTTNGIAFNIAFHDSTKSDGTYAFNIPNSARAGKIYYKIQASAIGYKLIDTVRSSFVISSPHDGKNDSCNVGNINLNKIPDKYVVVTGLIKDTMGIKIKGATTNIYSWFDTNYTVTPNPISLTADTFGIYSVKIKNASISTHLHIKAIGNNTGYFADSVFKDTTGLSTNNTIVDTVRMADLRLKPGNTIIPDSIVFSGTVKDSAGSKVLNQAAVRISFGPDTGHLAILPGDTVYSGTDGKFWSKLPNTANLSNLSYKVESIATGYALFTALYASTILSPGDGKNDTIRIPDLKLLGRSNGDTLFVRGAIYDSTAGLGKKPVKKAIVKIFLAGSFSDLQSAATPIAIDTTDTANGSYEFKVWNSPKQTPVFCKIQVSKSGHKDTVITDTANIFPCDWINDTIKVGAGLAVPIVNSFSLNSIAVVKTPVKIYDLNGRLIKSFTYESTGSTTGIPKYLKSIGVSQKTYIIEINQKTGIVRKQIINLK